MSVVPALERSGMEFMTKYVGSLGITNGTGQLRRWTCIVLQSTSTLPEENCMNKFDTILGRSFFPNIAFKFEKREFETILFFFSGLLYEQVLQYLPDNWSPIRIVSFTGDKIQIRNQEDVSMRVGSITTLCLNDAEFDYRILSRLKCLSRLEIQNVTSSSIDISDNPALEYVKLVDFVYKRATLGYRERLLWPRCKAALRVGHWPRLREVVLDRCFNVDFMISGRFRRRGLLQRGLTQWELDRRDMSNLTLWSPETLLIKDCPHLVDILNGMARGNVPELKEVQVINCPWWCGSTCNHEDHQSSYCWNTYLQDFYPC